MKRERIIWDRQVKGLGMRVHPTGVSSWMMQIRIEGRTVRKVIGRAEAMDAEQARARCLEMMLALRRGKTEEGITPIAKAEILFCDFVRGDWHEQRFVRWKQTTQASGYAYIRAQLLPAFAGLYLHQITRQAIARWFDSYSRTCPGGANRAFEILHEMLGFAVRQGHIPTNPAATIKKSPRRRTTRFLSHAEVRLLHEVLDEMTQDCTQTPPIRGTDIQSGLDIIRLLLLTGCRHREICNLCWSFVQGSRLALPDTKTGPRTVWLSEQALTLINRQARTHSPYIFPSPVNPDKPRCNVTHIWQAVKRQVAARGGDFTGIRIHDLHHTFASHAVMQGVNIPMISKLLGHRQIAMTLRYTHIHDKDAIATAERTGQIISRLLDGNTPDKDHSTPPPHTDPIALAGLDI